MVRMSSPSYSQSPFENHQYFGKNKELINANGRKFKVLQNLILGKILKIALIDSALIYPTLINSHINLFP